MASLFTNKTSGQRIGIFLQKCLDGETHKDNDMKTIKVIGMVGFDSERQGVRTGEIKGTFGIDIKTPADIERFMKKKVYKFILFDGEEIPKGRIMKTEEYKGGRVDYNKGNVAELIFAAAIFAWFTTRTNRVMEDDVKKIIFDRRVKANPGNMIEMAPNKGVTIKDKVELKWGMSGNNHRAVTNPALWPVWSLADNSQDNLVAASCRYANSENVTSWSNLVYENRSYNEITILAEGEDDQKETKVDVRVTITDQDGNPEPVNINVSLKKGNVGQFGQFGGVTYEVQKEVWGSSFGIEPPLEKSKYESYFVTKDHKTDTAIAFQEMYKAVIPVVKKMFDDPKSNKKMVQTFANFLSQQVTLGEKNVTLVTLKQDYAVEYNLDNVQAMLENLDFDFEYRVQRAKGEGDEDLPAIDINCKVKGEFEVKTLLTIRAKRGEGTYYRNIFEKKALFTDLFATILKATDR